MATCTWRPRTPAKDESVRSRESEPDAADSAGLQATEDATPRDDRVHLIGWVLFSHPVPTRVHVSASLVEGSESRAHRAISFGALPVWSSLSASARHFPPPPFAAGSQVPMTARESPVHAT